MHPIDDRILEFIADHHILTLAVTRDKAPYCATCYYAWLQEGSCFVITSDPSTRHIRDITESGNFRVAGAIALETRIVGKIRGIQFTGVIHELTGAAMETARKRYLKRFPVARLMPGLHLWSVVPDFIKLTDNRLGFGTKLTWTPESSEIRTG